MKSNTQIEVLTLTVSYRTQHSSSRYLLSQPPEKHLGSSAGSEGYPSIPLPYTLHSCSCIVYVHCVLASVYMYIG